MNYPDYHVARERMVREQVYKKGIRDRRVLKAMLSTPRHVFLDRHAGSEAYTSHAFPIGFSQTMSQPYMVAYLAAHLELTGEERVLELGTGSGYQAAVLAQLSRRVYTIERIGELASKAGTALKTLGVANVDVRIGDGALGWNEHAPFDRILLTAAATDIPETLLKQLCEGGFLLGPVGADDHQEIIKLTRDGSNFHIERLSDCSFVPLIREPRDGTSELESQP